MGEPWAVHNQMVGIVLDRHGILPAIDRLMDARSRLSAAVEAGLATHLPGSGWGREIVLTALGDHLYGIENEKLFRVSPQDGTVTHLPGSGGSGRLRSQHLAIICTPSKTRGSGELNPEDGTVTHLPGSRWVGEIVLTALGDHLCHREREAVPCQSTGWDGHASAGVWLDREGCAHSTWRSSTPSKTRSSGKSIQKMGRSRICRGLAGLVRLSLLRSAIICTP